MAPMGQPSTQSPQPIHFSSINNRTPLTESLVNESVGQFFTQGGFSHCLQNTGTSRPGYGQTLETLILDFRGLNFFSDRKEQTSSQILHPVHFFTFACNLLKYAPSYKNELIDHVSSFSYYFCARIPVVFSVHRYLALFQKAHHISSSMLWGPSSPIRLQHRLLHPSSLIFLF